jgi:hypothetical protein
LFFCAAPAGNIDASDRWVSVRSIPFADAREMARDARLQIARRIDPIEARDASKGAAELAPTNRQTFDQAAEAYLQKFEDGWKNRTHRSQWRTTLRVYLSPVLGKLDVAAIDTEQVLKVLEPIWSTIPETAARVRGRIETVLDFAGRNEGMEGASRAQARKAATRRAP